MSSITIQKMGISDLDTDAIVNAANKEIGRCDTGSAAIRKLQNKPGSYNDFVRMAVCGMDKAAFEGLKNMLLDSYMSFSVVKDDDITLDIFAEKLCDYFCAVELKTGKQFEKMLEAYVNGLDAMVEPCIAKTPSAKKNDPDPVVVPRSRKYYEKAAESKSKKNPTFTQLTDYSRLMLCLYTAVIRNNGGVIENFDYSVESLDPEMVINAMKKEEVSIIVPFPKKKRFDLHERYGMDECSLVISIIMLWTIINGKVQGECAHE